MLISFMRETYGQYADVFHLVNSKEDEKIDILTEFFRNKNGELLTETKKEKWLKELKELGLTDRKQEKNYTFDFILKYCRENKIVKFIRHKATKKEVLKNPELVYRKEYLQIKI